jgi:pimeloyl-ACP methyl ester carboxylesterase
MVKTPQRQRASSGFRNLEGTLELCHPLAVLVGENNAGESKSSTGSVRRALRLCGPKSANLDDTESLIMATTQRPTARRCLGDHTGKLAWKTKPSWYQVSAQDRMIPPATERWMAKRIHARETIELDTSHASLATRPTEVLELITNAADAVYHALASH